MEAKFNLYMEYILLVDDDDIYRFINTSVLRRAGVTVPVFNALNGILGIELIKSRYAQGVLPMVIFVDLNMPYMDGFEFIDALRSLDKPLCDTNVIILSSSVDPADLNKAAERAVRFITKPISIEDCFDIILSIDKVRRFK